jgi:hypothetical protein
MKWKRKVFVCPECGDATVGDAGWKYWCSNHETTRTITDDGVVLSRRLVEMQPRETVNA